MNAQSLLENKTISNKYRKWYWAIIENAKKRNKVNYDVFMELHHILPKGKFMFPEYKSLKDNPWNGVFLTLREHFLVHLLLTKFTTGKQKSSAIYGLMRFSSVHNKCTARQYAIAKSLFRAERRGSINPNKGKPGRKWTIEERNKHSIKMSQSMNTPSAKANCSAAKLGKPGHACANSLNFWTRKRMFDIQVRIQRGLSFRGAIGAPA